MKRLFLFLLFAALCQLPAVAHGATGCNYPSSLDSWTNKGTGDFLTVADLNQRTCAIEQLERELEAVKAAGSGLTSLNGLSGSTQTFSAINDANVLLSINSSGAAHTFSVGWAGILGVARGGHGSAPAGDDQVFVSSSSTAGAWKTLPDCPLGITYTQSSNTIGCVSSSAGVIVLDRVTSNTTVASTATETNLYSFSVPGGTLATNSVLVLTASGVYGSNESDNVTLRLKYGATTVAAHSITAGTPPPSNVPWTVVFRLYADGSTGSQIGFSHLLLGGDNDISRGTASIDSATAQNFILSADWNVSSALNTITLEAANLKKE